MNNANLQAEMIRSQIKVAELAQKNALDLQTERMKLMQREDIKTEKSYQQTYITTSADGKLFVQVQRFGTPLSGVLPISNLRTRMLVSSLARAHDTAVLEVSGKIDFQEKEFCFYVPKNKITDPKYILMAFRTVGVDFRVSRSKETELGIRLTAYLLAIVVRVEIPPFHGWYQINGEWHYAMPDEMTMEEVQKWI